DKRLVVLIDDVDRLPDQRAAEVFRLLVSVAAVPNLIFLVAVGRARPDADLVEKTFQVVIDLPLPERSLLQQMFLDRLDPHLADARAGGLLHPDYWIDVCANGIDPFLRTPRDVVRLVNAVASTYPTVRGEVNP